MNQLIDEIIIENNGYLKDLIFFKNSSIDSEKIKGHYWLKTEADFINIKNKTIQELENTLTGLNEFLINIKSTADKKSELLKLNDLFGLTNGKYYDFALNHDIYSDLEPDFYNLIKIKLEKYLLLEDKLKKASS